MDLIGATYVRDVEPGEVVVIGAAGHAARSSRSCRSGWRTASSSTSTSRGPTATSSARASTRCAPTSDASLAREAPVDADVVVPIPDSGVCAAVGFAEESGIPMRMGLIRNHYVGPHVHPAAAVDPPLRRAREAESRCAASSRASASSSWTTRSCAGTTSRKIVRMVKAAGAKEVHMRISCPPTISPCFYGVDTPRRSRADRRHAHARGDPPLPRRRDA